MPALEQSTFRAKPVAGHTTAAWIKLIWLGVIAASAGLIAMRRALGCSPDDVVWGVACSFRLAGVLLLLVDFFSLWILLWFAARYDGTRSDQAPRSLVTAPHALLKAAARASRKRSTPHRWKHRIGFWAFVAMVIEFTYLVYWSHIASV